MNLRLFITFLVLLALAASAAEWTSIAVPGAWEEKGPSAARTPDGVWYRAWVWPVAQARFDDDARSQRRLSVPEAVRRLHQCPQRFQPDRRRYAYGPETPDYARQNFTREYGTQYTLGIKGTF